MENIILPVDVRGGTGTCLFICPMCIIIPPVTQTHPHLRKAQIRLTYFLWSMRGIFTIQMKLSNNTFFRLDRADHGVRRPTHNTKRAWSTSSAISTTFCFRAGHATRTTVGILLHHPFLDQEKRTKYAKLCVCTSGLTGGLVEDLFFVEFVGRKDTPLDLYCDWGILLLV